MINTAFFYSPELIYKRLARTFHSREFHLDDIIELCGECETSYIKDMEAMITINSVPLTVTNGNVLLPCNVFTILDVYDESKKPITYTPLTTGAYISNLKYYRTETEVTDETVYINYIGSPIDEAGNPLIIKGHENACETFCKIRLFEEDAIFGKINANLWGRWNMQFSGQLANARSNPRRHSAVLYLKNLEVIRYDLLPKIGKVSLSHEFLDGGIYLSAKL